MHKHNGMRPQDIVILLKIMTYPDNQWNQKIVAADLCLSGSEITVAMERNRISELVDPTKHIVNKVALRNFLVYGLKYVFPAQLGFALQGIPTANAAAPMNLHIFRGDDIYVWASKKGTRRGNTIVPLYPKIVDFIEKDPALYEYLAIIDTIRVGKQWEVDLAVKELDKRLDRYKEVYEVLEVVH